MLTPTFYTITAASNDTDLGTISSNVSLAGSILAGTEITLTATPVDSDHEFVNWTCTACD